MSKNRVIVEAVLAGQSHGSVARQYGISKVWVGKLVARWRAGGWPAIEKQSTRPKTTPNATSEPVVARIIALREELAGAGLDAGPVTIAAHLHREGLRAPAASTIWRILTRAGLVTAQPRKRPRSSYLRFEADLPNECWQTDFTHWALADGTDTEILSWIDDHSRYALSLTAHYAVTGPDVLATFRAAIDAHGIPAATLTDNGLVFTTRFVHGPNSFEHELATLGITQKNGRPSHPQTQGKVERFQQTLKKWLRAQPRATSLDALQAQLDTFAEIYNQQRPHRSLHGQTPAAAYTARAKASPTGSSGALENPPRQSQQRPRHSAPRQPPASHRPRDRTQQQTSAHPGPRTARHRHRRRHRRNHPRPAPRPHPRLPTPRQTPRPTQRQPPTRRPQKEEQPPNVNKVARHRLTMSRDFTIVGLTGFEPATP
jgi:transposase InsO family protein